MSFLLPSNDEALRKRRRYTLIAASAGFAAILLLWRPSVSAFRALHARKLTAEAEAYLAQNRLDQSLASASEAFARGARDTRLLRLLLTLYARSGRPEAFSFWGMLARSPEATFADRRELLRWAVHWNQAEAANEQWIALQKEQPLAIETLRLGASYFEFRGDAERAVYCARETIAANPDDIETRILLGRVLIRNGSARDQEIGKRLLLEQTERSDQIGLHVLRLLASSAALLPFEAQQCLTRLQRHPERANSDDLTLADLSIQLTPYKRTEVISQTARDFSASGGDRLLLARWLMSHKAFDDVLCVASGEQLSERTDLALISLDALAALGRWSVVEETVVTGLKTVPPFEGSLFRARAATALKQTRVTELHWKQALDHAGKDPTRLLTLAAYAEDSGAFDAAERALRALAEQRPFARKAGEGLIRLFGVLGKTDEIRRVLERLRADFPDDPVIENDSAYLSLLDARDVAQATASAERLVKSHPNFLAYRVTLALGNLRQNRVAEARAILESADIRWEDASASHRAVYAAVLGRAGAEVKARELCQMLPEKSLAKQELALVREWM